MKVPFVDFKKSFQDVKDEVMPEIERVLTNGDLILRDDVKRFEDTLAKYVGTKYAVGLNSGTDALFLALKAMGIGKGDEVITSGYTFWATVEAIINVGATPVLADIGKDLLIDTKDLLGKITNKTKVIIPVHIGGAVCDMTSIMEIARKKKLRVIEDTAQALGAYKPVGDIQTYSFYPAKVLGGYGDGGAITTNNAKYAEQIRILRDHGRKTKHKTVCVGYNSRLDNLQAAILNVRIKHIGEFIKRRNEIAKMYREGLIGINCPESVTYQEFNIQTSKRNKLYDFLAKNGIETLKGDYKFPMKQPKRTLIANGSVLRLPIFPTLTDEQIEYIISTINTFINKKKVKK